MKTFETIEGFKNGALVTKIHHIPSGLSDIQSAVFEKETRERSLREQRIPVEVYRRPMYHGY